MRKRIAGNLAWLLAERAIQVLAGIGIVALLARALGVEGFAQFQYAQSLVLIAASAALVCGAEVVVPRLVADTAPRAQHRLLAHVFLLRGRVALLAYALLLAVLLATLQDGIVVLTAAVLGISILLREPFGVVIAWMQSRTHSRPAVLFGLIALAAKAASVVLLFVAHAQTPSAYAWAFAIESAVLAALLAAYYVRRVAPLRVERDRALLRALFTDGSLFWIGMILMMTTRRVDQLLLKPLVPLAELGAYAASMQLLDNFVLLATVAANAVAPLYIYAQAPLAAVRRNVIRFAVAMTALGTVGGGIIAATAPWIVHLLYGTGFQPAATLLRYAALGAGLVFADVALTLLAIHLRKPRWVAIKWAAVLATTVAVDSVLIPRFGASGAVTGYLIANGMAVVVGCGFLLALRRTQAEHAP
jgi:PST family polysaccharide transporter